MHLSVINAQILDTTLYIVSYEIIIQSCYSMRNEVLQNMQIRLIST